MAFRVKELMIAADPIRIACGATEAQCPTASATVAFCGATEGQCPTASAAGLDTAGSKSNLELLRRIITGREH